MQHMQLIDDHVLEAHRQQSLKRHQERAEAIAAGIDPYTMPYTFFDIVGYTALVAALAVYAILCAQLLSGALA